VRWSGVRISFTTPGEPRRSRDGAGFGDRFNRQRNRGLDVVDGEPCGSRDANAFAGAAERFENRGGLRRGLRSQFSDRLLGLGKLVVEEPHQRIVERVGARGAGDEEGCKERKDAQRESKRIMAKITKQSGVCRHPRVPG